MGLAGTVPMDTPERLAARVASELTRQPLVFILDRVGDLEGGVTAFRDVFWRPFYDELHRQRRLQPFGHRLVAVVADYGGDERAWTAAALEPDDKGTVAEYSRLVRVPALTPIDRDHILAWFEEMDVPDDPPGRRAKLATRISKDSKGHDDPTPRRVFERLRSEVLWPAGDDA
jgi:hypothetical protein